MGMILISHRGNIRGPDPKKENQPSYIDEALNLNVDVEIDVWYENGLWLGHDEPKYRLSLSQLSDEEPYLWVHCKNLEALHYFTTRNQEEVPNYFWHQNDDFTLTNLNYIWTFPDKELTNKSICVMPEKAKYSYDDLKKCYGICTDYILDYKKQFTP